MVRYEFHIQRRLLCLLILCRSATDSCGLDAFPDALPAVVKHRSKFSLLYPHAYYVLPVLWMTSFGPITGSVAACCGRSTDCRVVHMLTPLLRRVGCILYLDEAGRRECVVQGAPGAESAMQHCLVCDSCSYWASERAADVARVSWSSSCCRQTRYSRRSAMPRRSRMTTLHASWVCSYFTIPATSDLQLQFRRI